MDRLLPPAFMDQYLHKELPPTPEEPPWITAEVSAKMRIAQLERENEVLRQLIRSHRSTLELANDMVKACQQSVRFIRQFRQRQMVTEQNWLEYLSEVRNFADS